MLPHILSPSPVYHSSVFKNVGVGADPSGSSSSVGAYFMENLLRASSVTVSETGLHLLPSATSVFKMERDLASPMSSNSNSLKDRVRDNAMLFLGNSPLVPSSSPSGSGRNNYNVFFYLFDHFWLENDCVNYGQIIKKDILHVTGSKFRASLTVQ